MSQENSKGGTPTKQSKPSNDQSKSSEGISKRVDPDTVSRKHREITEWFFREEVDDRNFSIEDYRDVLFEKNDDEHNIIHRTIRALKKKRASAPPKALDFLEEVILQNPKLLIEKDVDEHIPLSRAAEYNAEILFRAVDITIPDHLVEGIKTRNCFLPGQRCPLRQVRPGRLEQCRKPSGKGDSHEPDRCMTPVSMQSDEDSCLHDSTNVKKLLEEDEKLRDVLRKAMEPDSKGKTCIELLIVPPNFDPMHSKRSEKLPLESFERLLQFCDDKTFTNISNNGYNPLQMAIKLYKKQPIDHQLLFAVISALVSRCPSSIYTKVGEKVEEDSAKTAYRLLKELPKKNDHLNAESQSRNKAEELLKRTCIGCRDIPWDQKQDYLYWDAKKVVQFRLNLSSESVPLDHDYISRMKAGSGLHFETALDSVQLPYWNPKTCKAQDHGTMHGHQIQTPSDETEIHDPYIRIFNWLWDKGVKKIFEVVVEDDGPEPHTNAAIRESLTGRSSIEDNSLSSRDFEVEVWKWKKFDICSDTIFRAAPGVKELYLYCSGNTAILRSWACESGLPKLTELEKLKIEIRARNSKDEADCKQYKPELQNKLASQCPRLEFDNITIEFHSETISNSVKAQNSGNDAIDYQEPPDYKPKRKEWIEKLDPFIQFIRDVPNTVEPSVKIALLDDGARLTDTWDMPIAETFHSEKVQYFVGPCSHGTEMVKCIREVFPWAQLYIARLDDSGKVEKQKFTTASVYKALKWALDMDVDIISMSWTFMKSTGEVVDEYERKFIELIKGLQNSTPAKRVLLFGSLPDRGATAEIQNYIPVGLDEVIKIGSATDDGDNARSNNFACTDFTLPGENIEDSMGHFVSGSSFSTAYAAGLAGLVIYCLKKHQNIDDPAENGDERTRRLNRAKTVEGMKGIFKILSANSPMDKNGGYFVRPYSVLQNGDEGTIADQLSTLRGISAQLVPSHMLKHAN